MKAKAIWIAVTLLLLAALTVTTGHVQRLKADLEAVVPLVQRSMQMDELCALAGEVPLGYASESFRANKSVIVMQSGESEQLKLTAHWKDIGTVSVDCKGDAAELRFEEDEWETYTTMQVTARHPGVTVARFRSSATDKTFAVWIMVE